MMERKLTIAEIILIAGTRVALGAGIGLLLSTKLNNDQRKAAGIISKAIRDSTGKTAESIGLKRPNKQISRNRSPGSSLTRSPSSFV